MCFQFFILLHLSKWCVFPFQMNYKMKDTGFYSEKGFKEPKLVANSCCVKLIPLWWNTVIRNSGIYWLISVLLLLWGKTCNLLLASYAYRGILRLCVFKQLEGCLKETLNTTTVLFNFSCIVLNKPYITMKSDNAISSPAGLLFTNTTNMF